MQHVFSMQHTTILVFSIHRHCWILLHSYKLQYVVHPLEDFLTITPSSLGGCGSRGRAGHPQTRMTLVLPPAPPVLLADVSLGKTLYPKLPLLAVQAVYEWVVDSTTKGLYKYSPFTIVWSLQIFHLVIEERSLSVKLVGITLYSLIFYTSLATEKLQWISLYKHDQARGAKHDPPT